MEGLLRDGIPAPPLALRAHHGAMVDLADLVRAGPVVVLFCDLDAAWAVGAQELGALRDAWPRLQERRCGVVVVSPGDAKQHAALAERMRLPFPLLVDEFAVADLWGVGARPIRERAPVPEAGMGWTGPARMVALSASPLGYGVADAIAKAAAANAKHRPPPGRLAQRATFIVDRAGRVRWARFEDQDEFTDKTAVLLAALDAVGASAGPGTSR